MTSAVYQSLPSANSLSRMLCMIAVVASAVLMPQNFTFFVVVLGFMHYMLAAMYSRRQFAEVMSTVRTAAPFFLVTLLGPLCWFFHIPIAWLSILHHNFNEVYMRDTFQERKPQTRLLRLSCSILNMFLFCTILRQDPGLKWINESFLFGGVIASALLYFSVLIACRRQFTARQLIDNSIYEIASFGLLALSMYKQVNIMHLFLYHFLIWEAYPLPKILKTGPAAVGTYIGWHLLFIPVALILSVVNPVVSKLGANAFMFFGYLHITMSFAISSAQPTWIIKLFRPRSIVSAPAVAAAVVEPRSLAAARK